jgi:hypothetical protein
MSLRATPRRLKIGCVTMYVTNPQLLFLKYSKAIAPAMGSV